jgi:(p)ppGpp synthase/HD superfamily hydrolase
MALARHERKRLTRGCELALEWHAGQTRKNGDVPYISHLLQVAGSVLEHSGDVDQAVACLLHDGLEDAKSSDERLAREHRIEEEFGREVLEMVLACTDTGTAESIADKAPWRVRKESFIRQIADASERSQLVCACDKRHNLYALVWDIRAHGLGYLDSFNAGPCEQVWYFGAIIDTLDGRIPPRLLAELRSLHDELRALSLD